MTEANQSIIEDPEVVARQCQVGRTQPWQPSHLLPGGYVHGVRYLVLEPDVWRHRLGDDARPPYHDPACSRPADQGVPGRFPLGAVIRWPALPCDERWIIGCVGVTHLQVYSRELRTCDQFLK